MATSPVTTELATKPPLQCPDCEQTFETGAGLNSHRRSAHGYRDPEATAKWKRRKAITEARKLKNSTPNRAAKLKAEYKARVAARAKLKGDYVCDKCGRHFQAPTALGFHKRATHGIAGKYSLKHQKQMAKKGGPRIKRDYAPVVPQNRKGMFACPECGQEYRFAKALGKHRSSKHGIPGRSKSAVNKRQQAMTDKILAAGNVVDLTTSNLTCQHCGKGPFATSSGLLVHVTRTHKGGQALNGNGTGNTNGEAIAFWIGQALRDCEAYAQRVELVPEEFISRLLAVVSRSSKEVRKRYRLSN